ncbi:hypothetical protein [Variovorax sp. YR752]|uniref:hypothetical protein n=1 Tax=Variovorax sp. YR752 TaxID=1884383 RepID=UPI003137CE78
MSFRAFLVPAVLALCACGTTADGPPAAERPAVYRSESSTGSNIARRDQRPEPTEEERARTQRDAEAMMRNEQIRRANLPRAGSTATGQ